MNICGKFFVNKSYTDRRINPYLGQLAEMELSVPLTVMLLQNG